MVTTAIVILISIIILLFYIGGLLVFTPDSKDDKYVISMLQIGFRLVDRGRVGRVGRVVILSWIQERIGYLVIVFAYKILSGRKYSNLKF